MKSTQTWRLSTKIANEANSSEHWTKKAKRHRKQKLAIRKAFLVERPPLSPPFLVVLTRIAPRELDKHDNLTISMKWVVDAIADYFFPGQAAGRADDSTEIKWEFKQERGKVREYGLRIEIIKELYESEIR